jgi:hypothetical protein
VTTHRADLPALAGTIAGRVEHWPFVRTFRSPQFRLVIGVTLLSVGVVVLSALMLQQANDPNGQYAIDFADYRAASQRMLQGQTPYAPEMLTGSVPAQGFDRYRYPPPFAQLLSPLAVLPLHVAATVWLLVQVALLVAALWIAAGAAGVRASPQRLVWSGVALTYFMPVFDTLWMGNIEGLLALSISWLLWTGPPKASSGLFAAGFLAAVAAVVKLMPAALLPAAIRRREVARGVVLGLVLLVVPSVLLAPQAWADYTRVLPNLLAGDARYATNLAPAVVALDLGLPAAVADLVRLISVVAGLALIALSFQLAGRAAGWAAAIGCAVAASLLLPASSWYHYLTLLAPLAVFAWVKAGRGVRLTMIGGGILVDAGLVFLPLATLGGALLAASSVAVVWPEPRRSTLAA